MIMNEFDMFRTILEKAEKSEVDKENRGEFFEGLNQLQKVLSFVKMRIEKGCVIFNRAFDTVKVSIKTEGDVVVLTYEKLDGFKEYRDKLCSSYEDKTKAVREAQEAAIRNFKLW